MKGTVYTETVVHVPPEHLLHEAPYQVILVDLAEGMRVTGRSAGQRVAIGDLVEEITPAPDGVRLFHLVTS